MPYWINTQKTSFVHSTGTASESVIVASVNQCQKTAYDIVQNHFSSEINGQLLMMVIGLAGSGKSYVINAIRGLLNNSCKVSAYFGIAAFNVNGTTLHSLLQLPIRAKRNSPLTSTALSKLQDDLNGIKGLIIDEYSVIGQKMLGWIDRRLKPATGLTALPFGGISIVLVGDVGQLLPVSDRVLYHNKPRSDLETEGFCMYHKFETVIRLEVNERAKGSDPQQETFRQLLLRARNGDSTLDD